jgi:hypothetical protein
MYWKERIQYFARRRNQHKCNCLQIEIGMYSFMHPEPPCLDQSFELISTHLSLLVENTNPFLSFFGIVGINAHNNELPMMILQFSSRPRSNGLFAVLAKANRRSYIVTFLRIPNNVYAHTGTTATTVTINNNISTITCIPM